MAQATESNGVLSFEGGLPTTVIALRGLYAIAGAVGKAPLSAKQASAAAEYLTNSLFVHTAADAATLALGLSTLASNSVRQAASIIVL